MVEKLLNIRLTLHAVQLYPEVAIAIMAGYFIMKKFTPLKPHVAVYLSFGISLVSQVAFAWPTDPQGYMMCFVMGIVQTAVAIGFYSTADKYDWPDKLAGIVNRRLDAKRDAV